MHDLAADVARTLASNTAPSILVGIGRGSLVAALAAAVEPERVLALALVATDAEILCDSDPVVSRRRWIRQARTVELGPSTSVDPMAALAFGEPLLPEDREAIWARIPRPVGWADRPTAAWTEGAPADLDIEASSSMAETIRRLVEALARTVHSRTSSGYLPG